MMAFPIDCTRQICLILPLKYAALQLVLILFTDTYALLLVQGDLRQTIDNLHNYDKVSNGYGHWTLPKVILTTQYLNRHIFGIGRVADAEIKFSTIVGVMDSKAVAARGRRVLFR
jgi:hypothetical protein